MNLSKKQQVYEIILSRIKDGTFPPGHRILINPLAEEIGCSIIPVREALSQLEADGFIQHKPYSGAIVSKIDETIYLESLSVLAVLEAYAASINKANITPKIIAELKEMNKEMARLLDEAELKKVGELNRAFHNKTYEGCENSYLLEQIKTISEKMESHLRPEFVVIPQHIRASIEEHDHIIHLLETKAPASEIKETIEKHMFSTVEAIREELKKEKNK